MLCVYLFIVHRLTWLPAVTAKKEDGKMTKLSVSHSVVLLEVSKMQKDQSKGARRELFDVENFSVLTHSVYLYGKILKSVN